jgi:hypothetical protein
VCIRLKSKLKPNLDYDAAHPLTNIQGQNNLLRREDNGPNKLPINSNSNVQSGAQNNDIDTSTGILTLQKETQITPKNANGDDIYNTLANNEPPIHDKNQFNTNNTQTSHDAELSTLHIANNEPIGGTIQTDPYNSTIDPTIAQPLGTSMAQLYMAPAQQNVNTYAINTLRNSHNIYIPTSKLLLPTHLNQNQTL